MDQREEIFNTEIPDEDEIDLMALLFRLRQKWYLIVLGLLIGCILGVTYNTYGITREYSSSTMIYMRSGEKTIDISDLSVSEDLNSDYVIIFKSRPILEEVIDDLNIDMSTKTLSDEVSVTAIEDTRIIKITVTDADPAMARDIANDVANFGIEMVKEIDSQAPYVVETAIANTDPVSQSLLKTTAIFGLAFAVIVCAAIVIRNFIDDSISSSEELEQALNVPVLTVVTEDKFYAYDKHTSKTKEKSKYKFKFRLKRKSKKGRSKK